MPHSSSRHRVSSLPEHKLVWSSFLYSPLSPSARRGGGVSAPIGREGESLFTSLFDQQEKKLESMQKRALLASSALLRRSILAGSESNGSSLFSCPLTSTARNSLVASTSGRTATESRSSEVAGRRRRWSSSSSTTLLSSAALPASTARSIHFCAPRDQGALPEVRLSGSD